MPPTDTQDYYRRRATSYEAIYHRPDPVRLTEQEDLARAIRTFCTDQDVLEVAAGTGWWSVHAAATARHLWITDAVPETLEIAQTKPIPPEKATFQTADAFDLGLLDRRFDAVICFFFLSHVAQADRPRFLASLRAVLKPKGRLMLADNVYVPELGGTLETPKGSADSYKLRTLPDGSKERVLKNYDSDDDLGAFLAPFATKDSLQIQRGLFFWRLSCESAT